VKGIKLGSIVLATVLLTGCIKEENYGQALLAGLSLVKAATLQESEVKKTARLSAVELDKNSKIAPSSSAYSKRLARITKGLTNVDGIKLNYKVYLNKNVNAFAMPDGTVRVYSGLMDIMPDDQVLAVIGHEIGHVKLQHSYNQMKKQMLTNAAFQAASATSGTVGQVSSSQLGAIAYKAVNAKFSQNDELQADQYSLDFLRKKGKNPKSMLDVIYTFQKKLGSGGNFLSSHPTNAQRINAIKSKL
jgi:putative metalloprotease